MFTSGGVDGVESLVERDTNTGEEKSKEWGLRKVSKR